MHYSLKRLYKNLEKLKKHKKNVLMRDLLDLNPNEINNVFIIRCDIERDINHTYKFAKQLNKMGLKATMYFHSRTYTFIPSVLKEIEKLGHEVSFHHECLDRVEGDFEKAKNLFKREVEMFKNEGFKLETICAHGEPGLKKVGYKFNYDLMRKYPDILHENGIKAEVYTTIKDNWKNHYASDVFSKYDLFWKEMNESQKTEIPLQILIHPHRWRFNFIVSYFEVAKDLFQLVMNKLFKYRSYKSILS